MVEDENKEQQEETSEPGMFDGILDGLTGKEDEKSQPTRSEILSMVNEVLGKEDEKSQPQKQEEAAQPVKDTRELEQQKLSEDFKKLYGVDYTPENVDKLNKEGKLLTLNDAEKALTSKEGIKGLTNYSTEDLAKLQLTVRQAEFDLKYENETNQAVTDRRQRIVDNKDKINDAILDKMEGYATGTKKLNSSDYNHWKLEKDSFNMLHENAPEELKKHCKDTLQKANKKINGSRGTVSSERLANATAQKLKYESFEIKDTDSLWTMAKKTARIKVFNATRTAKKKTQKMGRKVGKFFRGIYDNKLTRKISQRVTKIQNKLRLFPERAKKAIGKFWKNKIADPFKKKIVEPLKNKVIEPTKKFVKEKVVQPVKNGVQWMKDNPRKVIAGAVMVASTGIGFAIGGPAGGLAGAKVGGLVVGGAVVGGLTVKGAKYTYNKSIELKNKAKENMKESLKKSFDKNKEKIISDNKSNDSTKKEDLNYLAGRQVFNKHPEQMKGLIDAYKKAITPEGNEGKPLTEKEAAVKMYQTMIAEKGKGGLGLGEKQADVLMVYFNGNGTVKSDLADIKADIKKDDVNTTVSVQQPMKENQGNENTSNAGTTPVNQTQNLQQAELSPTAQEFRNRVEDILTKEQQEGKMTTENAQKVRSELFGQKEEIHTPAQTTNEPQRTENTGNTQQTPVKEPEIQLQPDSKIIRAQAEKDFNQMMEKGNFKDMLGFCQVKYAQRRTKVADGVSEKMVEMITKSEKEGGLGLDMEKDADRIAGFKAYLYEEKNIRNKKFVEPKQNKQSKEQNNSNTQTLVIQKKQEEMRLRA